MLSAAQIISSTGQDWVTANRVEQVRSRATRPASITTPDNIALIPLGACECASGSQVCSGTRAALTPKPLQKSAPAAINHADGTPRFWISASPRLPVRKHERNPNQDQH